MHVTRQISRRTMLKATGAGAVGLATVAAPSVAAGGEPVQRWQDALAGEQFLRQSTAGSSGSKCLVVGSQASGQPVRQRVVLPVPRGQREDHGQWSFLRRPLEQPQGEADGKNALASSRTTQNHHT
ncbi:hypothetical protein ACFPH6_16480 [Streptomyces xiangluensis]|uniref:Tat (Twin-arginine translocation) pathway signal sequence n=1 Tax=Streptomyces xiangluensis TaxID=2665720 RepID=A0ABV8YLE0_9ACTN